MDKDTVTVTLSIAAFVVSIATLLVALSQMKIASAKARLDLYNKRFNIYVAALDHFQGLWGKSEVPGETRAAAFIKAFRESQFLFKSSDGVYESFRLMKDHGSSVNHLNEEIEALEKEPLLDLLQIKSYRSQKREALDRCERQLLILEAQLTPYLRFEHASGWHPFK